MPQYILQTKELCKEFAHTAAVNRVSMNIQQGDIYGFIGENGAGKTTFMRMVAGLAAVFINRHGIRLLSGPR